MIPLPRKPRIDRFSTIAAASLLAAIAILAVACGGSGSSGFDILESQAISRVNEDRQCEEFEGLLICPADSTPVAQDTPTRSPQPTTSLPEDTPTPTPTQPTDAPTAEPTATATVEESAVPSGTETPPLFGTITPTIVATETPTVIASLTPLPTSTSTSPPTATPSPTTIPSPGILIDALETTDALPCIVVSASTCTLQFQFTPIGFDFESDFRIASRLVDAETAWSVAEPAPSSVGGAPFAYAAPIPIDLRTLSSPGTGLEDSGMLQVVVLAFERDPGPVPARVNRLSDTGADLAYVVAPFVISVE